MKNTGRLILYYILISIVSVLVINIFCPMRSCFYFNWIKYVWLILLCTPFVFNKIIINNKVVKLVLFLLMLISILLYGIYSAVIFLFLTILFSVDLVKKTNIIINIILSFILSTVVYVFYVLYIEGVFF